MKRSSTPRCAAAVITVVLAFAVAAAGTAATTAGRTISAGKASVFSDPGGDVQGAPDLTAVEVGTDSGGAVTIKVTAGGFAAAAPGAENLVKVYVDADRNESTGAADQGGAEYSLTAWRDADGWGWGVNRWNGNKYETVPQTATMSFLRSGDVLTWTVGKADLGNTSGFAFFVWSSCWDASDALVAEDAAPDDGSYTVALPAAAPAPTAVAPAPAPLAPPQVAVKPVIATPTSTPFTATSGKRFVVTFLVTRKDTGAPLTVGKMICDPSVLGKVVPHAESFKGGKARLSLIVPKAARGKVLKVKVTIVAGTKSATKTASFPVV